MSLKRITAQARGFRQLPALQALVHQCCAFIVATFFLVIAETAAGLSFGLGAASLLQGLLAAAFSCWRGLASWWWLIQVLFPVMLVTLHAVQLPPALFLFLFLFFLVLYWSTFRTRVPYYPSNYAVWQAVARLLPQGRSLQFVDIGSGFGGLTLHLAALRRESHFVGVELAPLPWFVSRIRSMLRREGVFMRDDYMNISLRQFDVVFAYLSPAAMEALWEKAIHEMQPGSLLLSYEFLMTGRQPDIVVAPAANGASLYGWHM